MKTLLLILMVTTLLPATMLRPFNGLERAIARDKSSACDAAKAKARESYQIVTMDPDCRCERTDGREWQCDVGFTYLKKKK